MDAIKGKDAFIKHTHENDAGRHQQGLKYRVVTSEMIFLSHAYFLRFLKYPEVRFL